MRNLKKVLALVLAMMMAFSLMVTANAIVVKDRASVDAKYGEAVDVVTALNILAGDDNGNLNPTNPMTRGQFATVLYKLATGNVDSSTIPDGYKTYSDFDDVSVNAWYAPYVNYVHAIGLMYGTGGKNFEPENNVTGTEFVLTVLRIIGYGKMGEFDGTWSETQLNVARLGAMYGITTNLGLTLSNPLKNQELAGLIFNTLMNPHTVNYSESTGQYMGESDKNAPTLGEMYFSLHTYDKDKDTDVTVAPNDVFGRPNTPKYVATIAGEKVTVGSTTNVAVKSASEQVTVADFIKNVANVADTTAAELYIDGVKSTTAKTVQDVLNLTNLGGNGALTQLFVLTVPAATSGGTPTYRAIFTVMQPRAYKLTASDIHAGTEKKAAYVTIPVGTSNLEYTTSDYPAGTVVLYYLGQNADNKTVLGEVKAMECVASGTLSATGTDSDGNYFRVGTSATHYYDSMFFVRPIINDTTTYNFYVDDYDYIAYADNPDGVVSNVHERGQYYRVIDSAAQAGIAGSMHGAAQADIAQAEILNLTDGTKKIVDLYSNPATHQLIDINGQLGVSYSNAVLGNTDPFGLNNEIVTAVEVSGKYVLTPVTNADCTWTDAKNHTKVNFTTSAPVVTVGTNTYYINNDTVVNIVEPVQDPTTNAISYKVTSKTGWSEISKITGISSSDTYVVETNSQSTVIAVYIILAKPVVTAPTTTYGIYAELGERTSAGTAHTFFVNGEKVTFVEKTGSYNVGEVYSLNITGDKLTGAVAQGHVSNAIAFATNEFIIDASDKVVYANDDTVVYAVDKNDVVSVTSLSENYKGWYVESYGVANNIASVIVVYEADPTV